MMLDDPVPRLKMEYNGCFPFQMDIENSENLSGVWISCENLCFGKTKKVDENLTEMGTFENPDELRKSCIVR